jgi:hypothetical protein
MEVDVMYKGTSPYNKGKGKGKRMTTQFGKGCGKSFGKRIHQRWKRKRTNLSLRWKAFGQKQGIHEQRKREEVQ